jgi:hypothetical protein
MAGIQVLEVKVYDAEGKEETAGLAYTTNAIAFLEARLNCSVSAMETAFSEGKMETFRVLILAGLEGWRKRHNKKRPAFTDDDAGDAFDYLGGITGGGADKLMDFFNAAFPNAPKVEEKGADTEDPT